MALTAQASQEIRTLSYLLHPPVLEEVGLVGAVRDFVSGFAKRTNIRVEVEASPEPERLSNDAELALFRIVQESLGNILKHSGSKTATIRLAQNADEITMEVRDEGRGVPAEKLNHLSTSAGEIGVGIAGMRERMRQLGGQLQIHSGPHGSTVRATLPLPRQAWNSVYL